MLQTADELASLWHLPHKGFTSAKIQWVDESVKPLPDILKGKTEGVKLGQNRGTPVYLPTNERTQHVVIAGKTGTGKSTLSEQMIIDDIAQGRGVAVIDPHGSLVSAVLRHGVPPSREDDVVVLNFGDLTNPPPLNPLYRPLEVENDVAANTLMAVMATVYPELVGKEMGDTLFMALMTISVADQPNMLDMMRVFDDVAFRSDLVKRLDDDETVVNFWERFDSQKPAGKSEQSQPVLRRLNAFYRNRFMRAIVCHPEPLDIRRMVADNKIILVSLAADEAKIPGEQRNLLAAALIAQIQMAAMAGAITKPPFLLYIDEAQHFVTTAVPQMLAEARKQGLGLVLVYQYFKQLDNAMLNAVEGTVGTIIGFEVGDSDARTLLPYFKPVFDGADLVSQGKFRAAVSMRYDNARQPAFTLETLPPPASDESSKARERELRRLSVERYTPKTYSEVHEWLRQRRQSSRTDDSNGDDDDFFISPKTP